MRRDLPPGYYFCTQSISVWSIVQSMTEKLSPHWLVFDVSMRHEDSKSLGGWQETLIHFTGLKRAKTKLNNLRSERFEKSDMESGLLFELLTLTQLKVVLCVEISEKAKNNNILFLLGFPYPQPSIQQFRVLNEGLNFCSLPFPLAPHKDVRGGEPQALHGGCLCFIMGKGHPMSWVQCAPLLV